MGLPDLAVLECDFEIGIWGLRLWDSDFETGTLEFNISKCAIHKGIYLLTNMLFYLSVVLTSWLNKALWNQPERT